MAYTAVKLADVNKAIEAVKAAQSKYATSLSSTAPSKAALETAQKNLEAATAKLQAMRDAFDKESYLQNNSAYNSALDAAKTAEQKLNEARDFLDSGRYYRDNSTYNNYVNAFNAAEQKLNQLRDWKDSGQYLRDNSAYQNAVNAIEPKINALREAENKLDNWSGNRSGTAWNNAVSAKVAADNAVSAAYAAKDKAEQAANTAAETLIRNQENTRNTAETNVNKTRETLELNANKARETAENTLNLARTKIDTVRDTSRNTAEKAIDAQDQLIGGTSKTVGLQSLYDKARDTYQNVVDQTQPNLDAYNEAKNNVANYVNDIKNSFGDIKNVTDLNEAKKLITDIGLSIDATKISDFQSQIKPQLSDFSKSFDEKLTQLQQDYKKNLELPTLSASQVDAALNRAGTQGVPRTGLIGDGNSIYTPKNQGRGDDLAQFAGNIDGLNLKSVNANILTGAALFGLYKDLTQKNKVGYTGDFAKAAQTAKVDISGMTQQEAYDAINQKGQGLYSITTRGSLGVDPTTGKTADHWSALYKREGDSLVPITDQSGAKVVQGFNSTWHQPFEDFGTFIQGAMPAVMMALPFILPGVGNALSSAISNTLVESAVLPTAFTMGAPAVTLGSIIGPTAVSALSGSLINGGTALLTGGDVGKAMLSGAAGGAASASAADISNAIMGGGQTGIDNIAAIAKAANLSVPQVQKIIASGAASGLTSLATDPENAAKNMVFSIASNFGTEEVKNLVTNSIDPKSLNGLQNLAVNTTGVVTSAMMNGQDIGTALERSANSLAINAAQAQYKYVPPVNVSSGASGFPIQERVKTYYEDLLASGFDEDVAAQLKEIYPNISDADAKSMATSLVGKVAAEQYGVPFAEADIGGALPPVEVTAKSEQTIFDKISRGFSTAFNLSEITDPNAPSDGKSALFDIGGDKGVGQGSVGGKSNSLFELVGFTSNGNSVYSAANEEGGSGPLFVLVTVDGKPQLIDEKQNVLTINLEAAKKLEDMAANVKKELKTNNADERIIDPSTFEIIKEPVAKTNPLDDWFESYYKQQSEAPQYNAGDAAKEINKDLPALIEQEKVQDPLKAGLFSQYAKDSSVMRQYIDEAYKSSYYSGMPLNTANISKTALGLLKGDIDKMFANAGTGPAGSGQTVGGGTSTSGADTGGGAGGTGGGDATSGSGAGAGTGTGGGGTGGTGIGTGGDGAAAAAAKAAAEKAAMAKRQSYYNQMMGVGSLPTTSTAASTKQASPSQAFYYGKEFGSPTQAISETGELVQKPYQALSVTQPGKEVAPVGVTGENDVSDLLSSILSQGDETSLNDLLEIIGGSQYG
jgi:uncharacterized protein YukE